MSNKITDALGQAIFIVGVLIYAFFELVAFLLEREGIDESWTRLAAYIMPPLGLSLVLYARHPQLRNFFQDVKRYGITKAIENIVPQAEDSYEVITDPFAQKTSWAPVKPVMAQLTMQVHRQGENLLSVSYSRGSIYQVLGLALAFIVAASSLYWIPLLPGDWTPAVILLVAPDLAPYVLVAGCVLVALALIPFYETYAETCIDPQKRTLEQTRPWFSFRQPTLHNIHLGKAYAIQLLGYRRTGSNGNSGEVRYEMNLVLNNAERINVMSGYNNKELRHDAEIIANSLALPLWDKTHTIYDGNIAWMQDLDKH